MLQVQSLRQRLNDLKKASIELKSKVLQEPHIESLIVSEILTNIHPNSSNHRVAFPLSQVNNHDLLDLPVSRGGKTANGSQNLSLAYSNNSSIFPTTPASATRNQDLILWNSTTSSHQSSPSREAIQQQIQKYKMHNDDIESKISALSSEIGELKVMQSEREQQIWKEHLPFINKQGKLGIFLTKLLVKEYDFDKIDYDLVRSELSYDKITFYLNYRSQKSLKLASIVEVRYLGDKRMRIEFKDQQLIFLYLQFSSPQQRQAWDLAIITNHKIVADKDLNKNLFQEERQIKASPIKPKLSIRIIHEPEETDDLRQTEKGIKRKGSTVRFHNEKKIERPLLMSNEKSSQSSSLKRSQFSNQRNQLEYTLNGIPLQTTQPPESQNYHESAVSMSSNKDKSIKDFMVFGQVAQSHHQSRANTSKFNVADVNFENIELYPTQEPVVEEVKKQPIQTISEWDRSLIELKQGYFFTKYAKNGFKPHNKKIFVSSEEQMLICANSEDLKSRKAIRIENITAIKYPAIGQGIGKYVKNARVENFCVIEYQNEGKDQVMELGCNKALFIKRFSQQFSQFLRRKGLLIND